MAIEIFDNEGKLRSISRVLTASVCDKLDGTLTFDFTVLQEGQQPILPGMTAKYGGQVYDIVRVKRGFSSGLEISEVSCEHISYTLNDKQYNLVTFVFEGTPIEGLTQLLAGTPFTVGIVEPNTMVECAFTDESPLNRRSALMKFADACGGEIEYDGYAINIRIHRGKSERVSLMDGTNVTGLSATYDSRKNVQSYEIQFFKWVPISVGDEVHIRYRPLSINVNTRIVGLTYNPFDRYSVRAEVGDYVPNLLAAETERLAAIKQEFRAANGKLESKIESVDGSLSELNQTVSGFDTRISSTEGSVSSLSQSINNIKSSVVTTDDTGNFIGTQIEQTPEWVRIAWNKYTDAVQFQNGGLYILDKTGKVLAILDGNGIVAEKGIFKGKVQSGDISKYGVEISDGTLKGYRNNELVAYVSTNSDMVVDDTVNPGMRIAAKGGIVLRSPYLAVAKDYLAPNSNGEMLLGGNGSFNAVTSFETTGEGEDRKLVFNYKNLSFTNGIMTSNLQGGSNIVDYPEQPNPPQADNTYQKQIEEAFQDMLTDLSEENMKAIARTYFENSTFCPKPKGEDNYDYSTTIQGAFYVNPVIPGIGTLYNRLALMADNIDWLYPYAFDCNSSADGVWSDKRWYGRKPISECGLTRNFLWPLTNNRNYVYSNFWHVPDMSICFFVVGYDGSSWYVSNIMYGDVNANLSQTKETAYDGIYSSNGDTGRQWILWEVASSPHHAPNNSGLVTITRNDSSGYPGWCSGIDKTWINSDDFKNAYPKLVSKIKEIALNHGLPGVSDALITHNCIVACGSTSKVGNYSNNRNMNNLFNAPIGIQVFNLDGVPHFTLGTCWKEGNYVYYYDNVITTSYNASYQESVTNTIPLKLPITKLNVNLTYPRIYATYDCSSSEYYHDGMSRLKTMRASFMALNQNGGQNEGT